MPSESPDITPVVLAVRKAVADNIKTALAGNVGIEVYGADQERFAVLYVPRDLVGPVTAAVSMMTGETPVWSAVEFPHAPESN